MVSTFPLQEAAMLFGRRFIHALPSLSYDSYGSIFNIGIFFAHTRQPQIFFRSFPWPSVVFLDHPSYPSHLSHRPPWPSRRHFPPSTPSHENRIKRKTFFIKIQRSLDPNEAN